LSQNEIRVRKKSCGSESTDWCISSPHIFGGGLGDSQQLLQYL